MDRTLNSDCNSCFKECVSPRMRGNCWRVGAAGVLSFVGGVFPAIIPGWGGVLGGACFGGFGNAGSTIWAYHIKEGAEAREELDHLKKENDECKKRLNAMEKKIASWVREDELEKKGNHTNSTLFNASSNPTSFKKVFREEPA